MVAFAKDYLPAESPPRSQNRAECFFTQGPGRAGHGAPAARFHAGENSCCRYDVCRGASLAQSGDDRKCFKLIAVDPETGQETDVLRKNGKLTAVPEGFDVQTNVDLARRVREEEIQAGRYATGYGGVGASSMGSYPVYSRRRSVRFGRNLNRSKGIYEPL